MKKRYYILTAIVAYLVLLLATVPANLFSGIINNNTNVHLSGISGSVWNGQALQVTTGNNTVLEKTRWSFAPLALLTGRLAFDIETRLLDNTIRARAGSTFLGRIFVSDLVAHIPARDITKLAAIPLAQLDGEFDINIDSASWKADGQPLATGQINWKNATVAVTETARLGNVSIALSESEQDMLQAAISNQGGDIKVSGSAELLPDNRYQLNIRLKPLAGASNSIRQSLAMFAKKQGNGEYLLQNSGSLNQIGLF